jgi:hypothetical protein
MHPKIPNYHKGEWIHHLMPQVLKDVLHFLSSIFENVSVEDPYQILVHGVVCHHRLAHAGGLGLGVEIAGLGWAWR